jgi:hypothetical protein
MDADERRFFLRRPGRHFEMHREPETSVNISTVIELVFIRVHLRSSAFICGLVSFPVFICG